MLERMRFSGTWRDYQARAVNEIERHLDDNKLHVVAAPGAGKTILGLEIVRRLNRPALIFAPSLAIRDQWRERLTPLFMTEMPSDDYISRDLSNPKTLTLSTYQSLDSFRRSDDLTELIQELNANGPFTIVLDEAHHLRRAWWECLNRLAEELIDSKIVALTATPPYDASFAEWNRYEKLCGPVDLEIGIPELVRNGDLCPHQDHLILSEPTEDTLALLNRRRAAIGAIQSEMQDDDDLLDWFAQHKWLSDPEACIEEILDAPEMLSAVLVLLGSAGRALPKPALNILGVKADDLPQPSLFWLERLLEGVLFKHESTFPLSAARRQELENRLHRHGLIEGGTVRLKHTRSAYRLFASSIAKMQSITAIAEAEKASLGEELRMVILSDHIRAGELPANSDAPFKPAKLGVIPIFETLRRAKIAPDRLAVLTGTLVIIPAPARNAIPSALKQLGLSVDAVRYKPIEACPDHFEIQSRTSNNSDLTRIITTLFLNGDLRILVGTQSLLGQGWDAPALNSLVLASNTASFMLSNQMRGRAIRIDPASPDKTANIWHLASIEPDLDGLVDAVATALDWGELNDYGAAHTDIDIVARRFKSFECISNGRSNAIENGLSRLNLDPTTTIDQHNDTTLAIASDRAAIAEKWRISIGECDERSQVRETVSPTYAPRALSWSNTIHSLAWTACGAGAIAMAEQLRSATSFESLGLLAMGGATIATIATLPKLAKAIGLALRNGSLENSLGAVTRVVIATLSETGHLSDDETRNAEVEVHAHPDGRRDVFVTGVGRSSERAIIQSISEILGPVQNPRYLLIRGSRFAALQRADYHAVPTILGTRKNDAETFARHWNANVGDSDLTFTRTRNGRRLLLKARMRSLAAGFQRSVERRSAWL